MLTTTFTVSFDVSEALFEPPLVTLDLGQRHAVLAMDSERTDRASLHYVFTYQPDGSELQGGDR